MYLSHYRKIKADEDKKKGGVKLPLLDWLNQLLFH